MPSAHTTPPQLDLQSLEFPSDRLTLGQIRRAQPELWASLDAEMSEIAAFAVFDLERAIAEKAFASALNLPDPRPRDDRRIAIAMLDREYQKLGLSTGHQQTQQLVRDFERAAVAQTSAHGGPQAK